jgi:hypothetical protein
MIDIIKNIKIINTMKAIQFAIFFHKLEKQLNVSLDYHIVQDIYKLYREAHYQDYANHTLFDLLSILEVLRIPREYPMNKKAIIDMIWSQNIYIPIDTKSKNKSLWYTYTVDYINNNNLVSYSLIVIKALYAKITLGNNDIFEIDKKVCSIEIFKNQTIVLHYDTDNANDIRMNISEFIRILDEKDCTVLYLQSRSS